ncbi:hypothetical protein GGX14DRAFT_330578, partial [Mycena pura]
PAAGSIVVVIGWEMALTVPMWRAACWPPWFAGRPLCEAQVFRDAYVCALSEARVLHVMQNAQHEPRRRFAEF